MIKELGPFEDEADLRSIAPVLQQWAIDVSDGSQVQPSIFAHTFELQVTSSSPCCDHAVYM